MDIQTEEQRALHESAERFLVQQCDFARHRRRLQSADASFDRALWGRFAEMGWLGVLVPESHGGLAYRPADALPIVEAMGAQFVAEPYQEAALASAHLLKTLGDQAQQQRWLPPLADGRALTLLAHAEHGARYELSCVTTSAQRTAGGYRLSGAKCALPFGDQADRWLVSARTSGAPGDQEGISLFMLEAGAEGVRFERHEGIGGEPWADMVLDGVMVPADARLGPEGGAYVAIEAAHELLLAAAGMEAIGVLQAVLESTCEYAKTRRQFGQPLASFQVIAHRLVDMFTQVELTRSLAWVAAEQVGDTGEACPQRRRQLLSACKAQVSGACRLVSEHAVQIHGGIGMTDELALSHQVRRLLSIERRLGDRFEHLGRLAGAVTAGEGLYA